MKTLRVVLWDQLSTKISSLADIDLDHDFVFMSENWDEVSVVRHHKKKLAFLFSCMRHFALELENCGITTLYSKWMGKEHCAISELLQLIQEHSIEKVIVTAPTDYSTYQAVKEWQSRLGVVVEIREDTRFYCKTEEFAQWAKGRKQLRMELFYRHMRKKHAILMQDNEPEGGQWNYDTENRKPPKEGILAPRPYQGEVDLITKEVIELIRREFGENFGDLEPFYFAVDRKGALNALELFIDERLSEFGSYQDAMVQGQPWMFHSHLSFYLNCGLLLPQECVQAAEKAYYEGKAPLNSVEGFIRQILGWREFVRGMYWLKMPHYPHLNFLEGKQKLPAFYWDGDTSMNCLRQCVLETKKNAYAHHIQRLMVLGNFALLLGVAPKYLNEWFLIVYADAFEWVEMPNVSGMVLFADAGGVGGGVGSKPYASSGSYINKMSNYCSSCSYKVGQKTGDKACPFNYLYWDFLQRNRDKLEGNTRLQMAYRTYDRMDLDRKSEIKRSSQQLFENLWEGKRC